MQVAHSRAVPLPATHSALPVPAMPSSHSAGPARHAAVLVCQTVSLPGSPGPQAHWRSQNVLPTGARQTRDPWRARARRAGGPQGLDAGSSAGSLRGVLVIERPPRGVGKLVTRVLDMSATTRGERTVLAPHAGGGQPRKHRAAQQQRPGWHFRWPLPQSPPIPLKVPRRGRSPPVTMLWRQEFIGITQATISNVRASAPATPTQNMCGASDNLVSILTPTGNRP